MELYHNSRKQEYRSPYGAVAVGTTVTISLDAPESRTGLSAPVDGIGNADPHDKGRSWTIYCGMDCAGNTGTGVVLFPGGYGQWDSVLWGGSRRHGKMHRSTGILGRSRSMHPSRCRNGTGMRWCVRFSRIGLPEGKDRLRCQENAAHPAGWKGTRRMVMQEWNDTPFYCRDEKQRVTRWPFFGGNLQGILKKLPYLKALGVGAIILTRFSWLPAIISMIRRII